MYCLTVTCRQQCRYLPEGLSHWAHTQHYVQVVPDSLYQVAKQGVRSLHHLVFPGRICQSTANLKAESHVMRTGIRFQLT